MWKLPEGEVQARPTTASKYMPRFVGFRVWDLRLWRAVWHLCLACQRVLPVYRVGLPCGSVSAMLCLVRKS